MKKRVLFDEVMISRMITRIANEIIEQNKLEEIVLVGIQTRGIYIAKRLKQKIGEIENINIPVESLDIKFYRDDLEKQSFEPEITTPKFKLDLNKKVVIIVDDVLYTGRTVRAAIDAIMDVSRPKAIRLAILNFRFVQIILEKISQLRKKRMLKFILKKLIKVKKYY